MTTLIAMSRLKRSPFAYVCRPPASAICSGRRSASRPDKYLRQVKLEAAREMLEDDLLSIKEIAARVGIRDPSYFSRIFKDVHGQSPSEYRETFLRERRRKKKEAKKIAELSCK
jgi:AraC-like DNA-binding protein